MTELARLALEVDATSVRSAARSLDDLVRSGNAAEQSTNRLRDSTRTSSEAILRSQQSWFSHRSTVDSAASSFNNATKQLDGVEGKLRDLEGPLASLANGFKSAFFGASIAVGLIGLKNAISSVITEIVAAQIQVDKLRNTLNFAVGREKAASELDFIRQSAQSMGLAFVSASEQYVRLAAAARGTTLEGQKTRDIFLAVSQASTVMGLSAQETEGAIRAIGQMISKNTVMSEELKGQLGERLPGAFQVAARAMGVTTGELNKMLETGKVLAEDFLPKFANQLTQETAPEIERASLSMQASVNRLSTAWQVFKQTVAESGLGQAISNDITRLGDYIGGLSDAMDRAKRSGSGMAESLLTGFGYMIARAPFDILAASGNLLNSSLNVLSLGALKLNTNISLLPSVFETAAQKAASLGARLVAAEADLIKLKGQSAAGQDSVYLKSETYQAYLLVQQLRAAKDAQDKLKGVTSESSTQAGIRAGGQAREAWMKQNQADNDSLAGLRNKQDKVPDGYVKDMAEIIRLNQAGVLVGKEYTDMLAKQQAALFEKTGANKGETEALKAAKKAQADAVKADIDGAKTMMALREKSQGDEMKRVADLAEAKAKAAAKATEAYIKELDARDIANADVEKMANDYAESIEAGVKRTEFEIGLMGKTEQARATAIGQYEIELRLQKQILEVQKSIADQPVKDRAIADLNATAIREKAAVANRVVVDEFKKTSDSINSTLTDALMRGFESGKDFARNLRDTVVNMFKTMVLRPIISAVMSPIAGAITGVGSAVAQEAGGGIASSIGLSAAISKAGAYVAEGASTVATAILGFGADALAFEGGMAMMGSATGVTSFMAGAGQAMAAMGPVGWAALAAVAVIAAMGLEGGETRNGASYVTGADGKVAKQMGPSGGEIAAKQAREMFDITKASIEGILTGLGSKAVLTGFVAGLESSDAGKGFAYAGGQINGVGFGESGGRDGGQFAMGDKSQEQALKDYQLNLTQSILEGLQVTKDIPATVAKLITDGLNGSEVKDLSQEAVNAILGNVSKISAEVNTFNAAMTALPFEGLKKLSFDAAAGLIAAAGGFEQLDANLGGFYQNFYSQEEQRSASIASTSSAFEALGLTMPALDGNARAAYRAMVLAAEGQDMTVEANRNAYTSLLALQGPMNQLAPTFDSIAQAAADAATKMTAAWADIQSARLSMSGASSASIAQASIDAAFNTYKTSAGYKGQTSASDFLTITQADFASYNATQQSLILQMINGFKSLNDAATSGSSTGGGSNYSGGSTTVTGPDYAADLANAKNALSQARTDMASSLRSISDQIKAFSVAAANAASDLTSARDKISDGYFAAKDAMVAAEQKVIDLQKQAADGLTKFAGTIDDFLKTINPATGTNASTASLKALLSSTSVLASGGDADAQSKLLSIAQSVLKSAEASSTSRLDYARSEAFVRSTLLGVRDKVAPPVSASSGMAAVVAAVVTPLQAAQDALLAAQLKVVEFSAAAALSGANTDLATRDTAMSSQALLDAFVSAQAASTLADSNLTTAQSLAGGLLVTSGATAIAGLISTIAQYGLANTAASDAIKAVTAAQTAMGAAGDALGNSAADVAGTLALTDTAALALANSLGLTGASAAALAAMLTNPATASEALAAALGLPGSNAQTLADKLGLSGTAATSFIAAVGNSAADFSALFGPNSSMAGSLSALTALLNTSGIDINALVNSLKPTGLDAGDIATHLKTAADALGQTGLSNALTLSTAQALAFEAAIKNSGLTVGSLQLSLGAGAGLTGTADTLASALGQAGLAGAAASLGLTFGPNGSLSGSASSLATLLGSAGSAAEAFANLVGNTQITIPSAVTANQQAVTNAYGAIGRKGFGSATNQVDQAGYDYWLNELETGMLTAATFQKTFLQAVASNTAAGFESAVAIAKASLDSGTKLPGFAVGTSYVPTDMVAQIHQGEEITPRPYVDRQASDRNETNALLARLVDSNNAMQKELAATRAELQDIKKSNKKMSDIAEKTEAIGAAPARARL